MKWKNKIDVFSFLSKDLVFNNWMSSLDNESEQTNFLKRIVTGPIDILIVEDDEEMSVLLEKFFQAKQYHTYTARSPEEAIYYYQQKNPFLVTVDLNLKKSSGHKVLQFLANLKTENRPWVIVVSCASQHEIEEALLEGGDFYLAKPLCFNSLSSLLKQIVERKNWGKNSA